MTENAATNSGEVDDVIEIDQNGCLVQQSDLSQLLNSDPQVKLVPTVENDNDGEAGTEAAATSAVSDGESTELASADATNETGSSENGDPPADRPEIIGQDSQNDVKSREDIVGHSAQHVTAIHEPAVTERFDHQVNQGEHIDLIGQLFAEAQYTLMDGGLLVELADGRIVMLNDFMNSGSASTVWLSVNGNDAWPAADVIDLLSRLGRTEPDGLELDPGASDVSEQEGSIHLASSETLDIGAIEPAAGPDASGSQGPASSGGGAGFTPYEGGDMGNGLDPIGPLGPTDLPNRAAETDVGKIASIGEGDATGRQDGNNPPLSEPDKVIILHQNLGSRGLNTHEGTDPDDDVLHYTITSLPPAEMGSLTIGKDGQPVQLGARLTAADYLELHFDPLPKTAGMNFNLTYLVDDGHGGTDTGVMSIRIVDPFGPPLTHDPNQDACKDAVEIDPTVIGIVHDHQGSVTFESESAGFRNTVGMYSYDADGNISSVEILFANASEAGSGGDLIGGSSSTGIDLNAGDQLGFFIVPNGFGISEQNAALLSDPSARFEFRTASGQPGSVDGGEPLYLFHIDPLSGTATIVDSQYDGQVFHSVANEDDNFALNPDSKSHANMEVETGTGILKISFEDFWNAGDSDFNDVVIEVDLGVPNGDALVRITEDPGSCYTAVGTDGHDVIMGTYGDDVTYGGDGNDFLKAGAGNDIMHGGTGNDRIFGGGGSDVSIGGSGEDEISSGDGDDLIIDDLDGITNHESQARIHGGPGDDTLMIDAADQIIDLTAIDDAKIQGIETIDLGGQGNELRLDIDEILNISAESDTLIVKGQSGDAILGDLSGATVTAAGPDYTSYAAGHATLIVENTVDQSAITT